MSKLHNRIMIFSNSYSCYFYTKIFVGAQSGFWILSFRQEVFCFIVQALFTVWVPKYDLRPLIQLGS